MKKYKIVYLITRFKKAGPINQTFNLIKNLDRDKFEPIVVSLFPEEPNDSLKFKFQELNIENYCLNLSKKQVLLNKSNKLENLCHSIQPDLIQSVGMAPYKISLNYKKSKHLVTVRNYFFEDYPAKHGKFLGEIMAWRDTKLIKKKKNIVTCSKSLSDLYYNKKNIELPYIRNGVDLSNYKKTNNELRYNMRIKLGLPTEKKIAIYTGQFLERKNQEFAIEGILSSEFNKDIYLILLGQGKNLTNLKDKYLSYPNVIFAGEVENVEQYLQASDLYISTSKSEGMPNGVLEAMSVGLPVLLSNILQHKEIVEINKNVGELYIEKDIRNFHEKLKKLLEKDLTEMGEEAHSTVTKSLDAERMSLEYQELYTKIINNIIKGDVKYGFEKIN